MIHLIRLRSPIPNVSSTVRRVPHASTFAKRGPLSRSPPRSISRYPAQRSFTTGKWHHQPSQSPPRNLDIFLPRDAAVAVESTGTEVKSNPVLIPISQTDSSGSRFNNNSSSSRPKLITAHHDLRSYLSSHNARIRDATNDAARHRLNNSTVHLGTRYEYLIQSHLQSQLGFSLTRIGGRGDGGVDLIGTWTLPVAQSTDSNSTPSISDLTKSPPPAAVAAGGGGGGPTFRILLQAKRIAAHRKPMPALMRELEGTTISASSSRWISSAFVMHGLRASDATATVNNGRTAEPHQAAAAMSDFSHLPTLGILATTCPLTAGIENAMASSRRCLMYICLEEVVDHEVREMGRDNSDSDEGTRSSLTVPTPSTRVRQIAWNTAAANAGLLGYNVVTRYIDNAADAEKSDAEAILMCQGQPVQLP